MTAPEPPPAGDPWTGPPTGGQQPGAREQPGGGWQPPGPAPWEGPRGGQPGPWQGGPPRPSGEDTTWAVLAHVSYFVLGLVAPLVIYLVKRRESPFVRQHAAEALNFHITVTLATVVCVLLVLVLVGFVLLPLVLLGGAVLSVLAAVAAGRGEPYRYPLTLRLVR
jgi:uncharacterized protein